MTKAAFLALLDEAAAREINSLRSFTQRLADELPRISDEIHEQYLLAGQPYGKNPDDAWRWYCERAVAHHLRFAADRIDAEHDVLAEAHSLATA